MKINRKVMRNSGRDGAAVLFMCVLGFLFVISQVYEIFAKENARAARRANYDEGAEINKSYGCRNYDWVYYNADYYYQSGSILTVVGILAIEIRRGGQAWQTRQRNRQWV